MAPMQFLTRVNNDMAVSINGNGGVSRDFTFVGDIVAGFERCLSREGGPLEIINFAHGEKHSIRELLCVVEGLFAKRPCVVFNKALIEDLNVTLADTRSAIRRGIGPFSTPLISGMHEAATSFLSTHPVWVVALIATCSGRRALLSRALESVCSQTLVPALVLVVLDVPDSAERDDLEFFLHFQNRSLWKLNLGTVDNWRTKQSASGSWNSGIVSLLQYQDEVSPCDIFIAILDDDDMWLPHHIEQCVRPCKTLPGADVVVSGIIRVEDDGAKKELSIPTDLKVSQFLIGNPHVQGSNMFVRMSTFLQAGLFDEYLPSCTDRDMMIRILDLGNTRVSIIQDLHSVIHFAETSRLRLSTRNSASKNLGLDRFWNKYRDRMNLEEQRLFCERCTTLFGWTPPKTLFGLTPPKTGAKFADYDETVASDDDADGYSEDWFVVGITSDSTRDTVGPLLEDLQKVSVSQNVKVDVFILENGPRGCVQVLEKTIKIAREKGLRCSLVTLEQQARDIAVFPSWVKHEESSRRSIAETRTMIQFYCFGISAHIKRKFCLQKEAIVLILDDDKRISNLPSLSRFYSSVLGCDIETPPLPAASMFRTQAIDVLHNLQRQQNCANEYDRSGENDQLIKEMPDYYHDLSASHFKHLECPFWMNGSVESIIDEFSNALSGLAVSRPLVEPCFTKAALKGSIERGGSTIIFDLGMLLVPNSSPQFNGRFSRRSDMLWAIHNRARFGRNCVRSNKFVVTHDRTFAKEVHSFSDLAQNMMDDLLGAATVRGFSAFYDGMDAGVEFSQFLLTRVSTLRASVFRIFGVLRSMSCLGLQSSKLAAICELAVSLYNPEQWDLFLKKMVVDRSKDLQCQFETWLRADSFVLGDSSLLTHVGVDVYTSHRKLIALEFLEQMIPSARWEYVSAGGEGVIFRSDTTAFKYLDGFLLRGGDDSVIKRLIGSDCGVLNIPFHFQRLGTCHAIMKSKFVFSASFFPNVCEKKKLMLQMFDFVGECRRYHIVCKNVSKNNFLVSDDGTLHFVDFGIDISEWTATGEMFMLKRLFLLLFRHNQANLQELMKESLFNSLMPELSEFNFFREALEIHLDGKDIRFFNQVEQVISDLKMSDNCRVLDYGCGSGYMLHRFARKTLQGFTCVGFDPDESHMQSVTSVCGCSFQSKRSLLSSKFDLIMCLRVICICDDAQADIILQDLHDHLDGADSVAVVAIQNPFFANLGDAPCSTEGHFFRPMHVLEHLISKAGLKIVSQPKSIPSVSIPDLLPSSDYLLLSLKKVNWWPRSVLGSLVIRTCAMDARTIYFRVIHLVKSLIASCDSLATERVVIVDTAKTSGFVRGYDEPQMELLCEQLKKLQFECWIDRIVMETSENLCDLYERWFGVRHVTHSHAIDGTTVALGLQSIECARPESELVLIVDSDIMVGRMDVNHSIFHEALEVFADDQKRISWAVNVYGSRVFPNLNGSRFESRASVVHRPRLLLKLPMNVASLIEAQASSFAKGYHRLFDLGGVTSVRGGHAASVFFVHPENEFKVDSDRYMLTLSLIERAQRLPSSQLGQANLCFDVMRPESLSDMMLERNEPMVVVVCGRVTPSQFLRCMRSLEQQTFRSFSLVLVDDANDCHQTREFIRTYVGNNFSIPVSLIQPYARRFSLPNHVFSIRSICQNPDSIICSVDADDWLANEHVLQRVWDMYSSDGFLEVAVGGMHRTDKVCSYPVSFEDARFKRGGNVWSHLKTFRKHLFDRIRDVDLRNQRGKYYDLASDWAFMLPMVEMAIRCEEFQFPTYIYNGTSLNRLERSTRITEIVANPPYSRRRICVSVVGDARLTVDSPLRKLCVDLGLLLAENGFTLLNGGLGGVMEQVARGVSLSRNGLSIGIIPGSNSLEANPFTSVIIPTSMDHARNAIVSLADAIVVVGGGSGTLSEVALAWSNRRLVVALRGSGGIADKVADKPLDSRIRYHSIKDDKIFGADSIADVIHILQQKLPLYNRRDKIK